MQWKLFERKPHSGSAKPHCENFCDTTVASNTWNTEGHEDKMFAAVCQLGLEGIVSKPRALS